MLYADFVAQYDQPEIVVLLLGKRKIVPGEQHLLEDLGAKLASTTKHILFRSGNAGGADELFAAAVSKVNQDRIEVVTPYLGHRKKYSEQYKTISLDQIDLASEPELTYHAKKDNPSVNLVKRYENGFRDYTAMKGAYLLRDTLMVVGAQGLNVPKASFAIFYDDLTKPKDGGTGHTMRVCSSLGIPFIDQRVWLEWI